MQDGPGRMADGGVRVRNGSLTVAQRVLGVVHHDPLVGTKVSMHSCGPGLVDGAHDEKRSDAPMLPGSL